MIGPLNSDFMNYSQGTSFQNNNNNKNYQLLDSKKIALGLK